MKKLLFFILLPLIFSCGGKSSENLDSGNVLENFSFSVDTLVMDPGDQLVNLQFDPSKFDLSTDKRLYYFIHRSLGVLSVFDLSEKRLIKQIQFEKEGPNSVPSMVNSFQSFDENRFFLTGFRNIGIYDSAVVKQISIPFGLDQFSGLSEEEGYALTTGIKANDSRQLMVSLPNDPKKEQVSMAILEMNAQKGL